MVLSDLLKKSCEKMYIYSEECTNDFLVHNSSVTTHSPCCNWYHGAWQYLRILDCVSAPQWHEEFYTKEILCAIENIEHPTILISGAADYSMLHLVIEATKESKKHIYIDMVDLCGTPIKICKWYLAELAKEEPSCYSKYSVETEISNIALFDRGIKYDIICTDAFLTRFSSNETPSIVEKWRKLLKENGKIITTIRLLQSSSLKDRSFASQSVDINLFLKKVKERYRLFPKTSDCISINELSFLAARYIIRIKSNPFKNIDDIKKLFLNSGLYVDDKESIVVEVPGEIRKTNYYCVVATKEKSHGSG